MSKKVDYWNDSFAREVDGLEYEYPLEVGDVVYYKFDDKEANERSKRYPMKVIEVGVPIATDIDYEHKRTPHGRKGYFRVEKGDYVEGVRVQHIWYEGDKGRGHKENFPVTKLVKYTDWKSQKDRYEEWREQQIKGE